MLKKHRSAERFAALFLLGTVLLVPPLVVIVDRPVRVMGIPVLYLYLFAAWSALIAATALVSSRIEDSGSGPVDARDAADPTSEPTTEPAADA